MHQASLAGMHKSTLGSYNPMIHWPTWSKVVPCGTGNISLPIMKWGLRTPDHSTTVFDIFAYKRDTRIPRTMRSSFRDINVPRIWDGAVSAIYKGAPCMACKNGGRMSNWKRKYLLNNLKEFWWSKIWEFSWNDLKSRQLFQGGCFVWTIIQPFQLRQTEIRNCVALPKSLTMSIEFHKMKLSWKYREIFKIVLIFKIPRYLCNVQFFTRFQILN